MWMEVCVFQCPEMAGLLEGGRWQFISSLAEPQPPSKKAGAVMVIVTVDAMLYSMFLEERNRRKYVEMKQ